jgi:hypothetical protein
LSESESANNGGYIMAITERLFTISVAEWKAGQSYDVTVPVIGDYINEIIPAHDPPGYKWVYIPTNAWTTTPGDNIPSADTWVYKNEPGNYWVFGPNTDLTPLEDLDGDGWYKKDAGWGYVQANSGVRKMTAGERQQYKQSGGTNWTTFNESDGWAWMPIPPKDYSINLVQSTDTGILCGVPQFNEYGMLTSVTPKLLWTQDELSALAAIENVEDFATHFVQIPYPAFDPLPNSFFSDSYCSVTNITPSPNEVEFGDEWDMDFTVTIKVNSGITIPRVGLFLVLARTYQSNEYII